MALNQDWIKCLICLPESVSSIKMVACSSILKRYQEEWEALLESYIDFSDERPTNPLLLDVPPEYFSADCKMMVFGQETNDWEGLFPHPQKVVHLLESYRNFYTSGSCYSYGGQFWNGVAKLKRALTEKIKPSGKTLSVIWNNVIKIGKANSKGNPSSAILKWEDNWFDVVSFEISTMKPDIIIFLSGPNYDKYIKRIFSDASFEKVSGKEIRQLARVRSHMLPEKTIRTYHPNYLWRHGFDGYLNDILGALEC